MRRYLQCDFQGVQKFEDLNKSDIGIAGGKGANLGELTQAGIPVPPGFVVTAETYEKFMEDSGINDKVLDILDSIDINDTKALQAAAEEIRLYYWNSETYTSADSLTKQNASGVISMYLTADGTYKADMEKMYEYLFNIEPMTSFKHLFNVKYVNVVSLFEGYGHGSTGLGAFKADGSMHRNTRRIVHTNLLGNKPISLLFCDLTCTQHRRCTVSVSAIRRKNFGTDRYDILRMLINRYGSYDFSLCKNGKHLKIPSMKQFRVPCGNHGKDLFLRQRGKRILA